MRLTLRETEVELLLKYITNSSIDESIVIKISKQLEEEKSRDISNKQKAAKKARETRIEKTKLMIKIGLKKLENKNEKITAYSLCKSSGISYTTCRKYLSIL